jgi:sterol desaturase/sphingolipid hydroxylase (fatty acid hydroxylase superfamily)
MFWFCAALSAAGVLESVICSCLVAELAGYWLHGLLHSYKLPFLNRSHMVHHLLLYGPMQPRWAERYKGAAIHHHSVDGASHMDTNFGIGFFLFDRIFRTLATRHCPLNRKGLAVALQRYRLSMSLDTLRRESAAEGEAAFQ